MAWSYSSEKYKYTNETHEEEPSEIESLRAKVAELELENAALQEKFGHCNEVRNATMRELERVENENARLTGLNSQLCAKSNSNVIALARAEEQLAIAQADNQRLRAAGNELALAPHKNDFLLPINKFLEALATPLDASALEAIVQKAKSDQSAFDNQLFLEESKRLVQKAGEVMRERFRIAECQGWLDAKFIRALPGVNLEDLK